MKQFTELRESTAEYGKSLRKIANDKKLKSISKKDKETLAKIADMLAKANEDFKTEALSDADKKKRLAMIKKAVEKISKSNADKAKKDALRMMKDSGMFDEDVNEAGSQGMFLVIQGTNDNKQKVISMHKRKVDAIKARDAWNNKNKPTKKTHNARVSEVGKFATTDGKPKSFKVGDNIMYSDFARSIVKESLDEGSPLVMSDMETVNAIVQKIMEDMHKLKVKGQFERAWPKVQALAKMAGYGVTKSGQSKGNTFRYDLKK